MRPRKCHEQIHLSTQVYKSHNMSKPIWIKAEGSPAYNMLSIVREAFRWKNAPGSQYESALWETLKVALVHDIEFDLDDFHRMEDDFGFPHWTVGGLEAIYALACAKSNKSNWVNGSAARACENYIGRKPYIVGGERLAVGYAFKWKGTRVKVTSFRGADEMIACAYGESPANYRKVTRRFRIPRPDFKTGASSVAI